MECSLKELSEETENVLHKLTSNLYEIFSTCEDIYCSSDNDESLSSTPNDSKSELIEGIDSHYIELRELSSFLSTIDRDSSFDINMQGEHMLLEIDEILNSLGDLIREFKFKLEYPYLSLISLNDEEEKILKNLNNQIGSNITDIFEQVGPAIKNILMVNDCLSNDLMSDALNKVNAFEEKRDLNKFASNLNSQWDVVRHSQYLLLFTFLTMLGVFTKKVKKPRQNTQPNTDNQESSIEMLCMPRNTCAFDAYSSDEEEALNLVNKEEENPSNSAKNFSLR